MSDTALAAQHCEACRVGAPLATDEQKRSLGAEVPDWEVVEIDDIERLQRTFEFKNFVDALAFTNEVGRLAEAEGHHPMLVTEWGRTAVQWWSHKIRGLHVNDFVMAAKCDNAYRMIQDEN